MLMNCVAGFAPPAPTAGCAAPCACKGACGCEGMVICGCAGGCAADGGAPGCENGVVGNGFRDGAAAAEVPA